MTDAPWSRPDAYPLDDMQRAMDKAREDYLTAPTGFVRYECPVDRCSWTLDEYPFHPSGALVPAPTIQESINLSVAAVCKLRVQAVEDVLRAHMMTHTPEEHRSVGMLGLMPSS